MKHIVLLISILSNLVVFSQDIDLANYIPIESIGELPADFTERTSRKVAEDIENEIDNSDRVKTKKAKEEFILKSNYFIDDLLMSGNVLFGDPVTKYLNRVADRVLKDEPALRKELRFYCIKSNITNAFTTNQGMIFVTLGLISQLENEAQLAFVIGHEITHYKRKHVINSVLEADKIFSRKDKYNRVSQDDNIIKLSNYSKSLELESDSTGFHYVQNAGYDLREILSSFDVLQFSYLPFNEIDIDFSEFNTFNVHIPNDLILDTINPINFEVDEDDSKSTHPNLNTRRDKTIALLKNYENQHKGIKYVVSEKEFNDVKSICRFESIRINLKNLDYITAFYNIKVLQKEFPNNQYLDKSMCKALYGLSKVKLANSYTTVFDYYDEYEGNISSAYHFFEKIETDYLALLSIKKIYEESLKQDNPHLKNMLNNLVSDFIWENGNEHFNFEEYFVKKEVKIEENLIDTEDNEIANSSDSTSSDEPLSKYDKLRKIQSKQSNIEFTEGGLEIEKFYFKSIFNDYEHRDGIAKVFETNLNLIKTKIETKLAEENKYDNLSSRQKYYKEKEDKKQTKNDAVNSNRIGAQKVVFIDPRYFSIDERKGVKLENSENMRYKLYDQIARVGEAAGLSTEILTPKICTIDEFQKMNHLSTCNDWISEIGKLSDIRSNWNIIPSESEYMNGVSNHYNTELMAFTGVIVFKEKKIRTGLLVLGLFIPYTMPFAIYSLVTPKYQALYYTYVFNSSSGEIEADKLFELKSKPSDGNIQSDMFYLFSTLKLEK